MSLAVERWRVDFSGPWYSGQMDSGLVLPVDSGQLTVDSGQWTVDSGQSRSDGSGQWTDGNGQWSQCGQKGVQKSRVQIGTVQKAE